MSRPGAPAPAKRRSSVPIPSLLSRARPSGEVPQLVRRPSGPKILNTPIGQKNQRTSKTSHRHVELPIGPQTKPLPGESGDEDDSETLVTVKGTRDYKTVGERMSKSERNKAGYRRLTAYCISESLRTKLLAAFLRREHNLVPRVFDEATYVMYHLPLLPGYSQNVNIRSSLPAKSPGGKSISSRLEEAEENGYEGAYFHPSSSPDEMSSDGFIPSSTPENRRIDNRQFQQDEQPVKQQKEAPDGRDVAEVIYFAYGVVVFFGLTENQERSIIDDIVSAGILVRKFEEEAWEIEEFHYAHDPNAAYPRIYNDLFTFKSPSHLLKLSISHAIAQSTLLAHYESKAQTVLSDPSTISIPRTLAATGELKLRRHSALRITGKLFQLKRDINLVSNVLDVPELFWSEASLKDLYDAVREYMEIGPRVQVLNERLAVASDLLDLIHGHLNNNAMERITWIIIWLIVVACLVELGEVLARLVVHATVSRSNAAQAAVTQLEPLSPEQAFLVLEGMMTRTS